jgi:hypothetical protein
MTAISIHEFYDRAQVGGEIRIAKGDENRLNRGTLGERFVSLISDVKESLGNRDETRVQRQQNALARFREALVAYYGQDGETAFQATGLGDGGRLTGERIKQARDHAETLRRALQLRNLAELNRLLGDDFVSQQLGQEGELTGEQRGEYEARLRARVGALDVGTTAPDELEAIAQTVLAEVRRLSEDGLLDEAIAHRLALSAALKQVLQDCGRGRSARRLTERLGAVIAAWNARAGVETGGGDPETAKLLVGEALAEALRELKDENPGLLAAIQPNALSGSMLGTILGEVGRRLEDEALAPRQREALQQLGELSQTIVVALGGERGWLTGSRQGDLERMWQDESPPELRNRVGRAMDDLLQSVHDNPSQPAQFLRLVRREFGATDPQTGVLQWQEQNEQPTWNSPALLEMLELQVRDLARQHGFTIAEAVARMSGAIAADEALPPGLREKLNGGLQALRWEAELLERLRQQGLPDPGWTDIRALFLPDGGLPASKWEVEHALPGALAVRLQDWAGGLEGGSQQWLIGESPAAREAFEAGLGQLAGAQGEPAKRAAIAEIVGTVTPMLGDSGRAPMLLQLLLREAGLPPAMLPEGVAPSELTGDDILAGQLAFVWRQKDPGLDVKAFLIREMGLRWDQDEPRLARGQVLRRAIERNDALPGEARTQLLDVLPDLVCDSETIELGDGADPRIARWLHGKAEGGPLFDAYLRATPIPSGWPDGNLAQAISQDIAQWRGEEGAPRHGLWTLDVVPGDGGPRPRHRHPPGPRASGRGRDLRREQRDARPPLPARPLARAQPAAARPDRKDRPPSGRGSALRHLPAGG